MKADLWSSGSHEIDDEKDKTQLRVCSSKIISSEAKMRMIFILRERIIV